MESAARAKETPMRAMESATRSVESPEKPREVAEYLPSRTKYLDKIAEMNPNKFNMFIEEMQKLVIVDA